MKEGGDAFERVGAHDNEDDKRDGDTEREDAEVPPRRSGDEVHHRPGQDEEYRSRGVRLGEKKSRGHRDEADERSQSFFRVAELARARREPPGERQHEPYLQKFSRLYRGEAEIDPPRRAAGVKADPGDKDERGEEKREYIEIRREAAHPEERRGARREKGEESEAEAEAGLEQDILRYG